MYLVIIMNKTRGMIANKIKYMPYPKGRKQKSVCMFYFYFVTYLQIPIFFLIMHLTI